VVIETARLVLRPFTEDDREDWAALNGDPRVSDWLGGPIDRASADRSLDASNAHIAERGYGFWAAELRATRRLVGMIGLRHDADVLAHPVVEAGWRLAPEVWGQGLASEGAAAALDWGFANLDVAEIVAFTAQANLKSQQVMRRIGMQPDPGRDFDHPNLAAGHPLHRHLVFAKARP
jgi:RimJ/RimL family protein N-acetyltransferase